MVKFRNLFCKKSKNSPKIASKAKSAPKSKEAAIKTKENVGVLPQSTKTADQKNTSTLSPNAQPDSKAADHIVPKGLTSQPKPDMDVPILSPGPGPKIETSDNPRKVPTAQQSVITTPKRPAYARGQSFVPSCCPHPVSRSSIGYSAKVKDNPATCPLKTCMSIRSKAQTTEMTCRELEPFALPKQEDTKKIRLSKPPTTAEVLLAKKCENADALISQITTRIDKCFESLAASKAEYEKQQSLLQSLEGGEDVAAKRLSCVTEESSNADD